MERFKDGYVRAVIQLSVHCTLLHRPVSSGCSEFQDFLVELQEFQ